MSTIEEIRKDIIRFHDLTIQDSITIIKKVVEDVLEMLEIHIILNEDEWSRNPQNMLQDFTKTIQNK